MKTDKMVALAVCILTLAITAFTTPALAVVPYVSDANTVLLDHFEGTSGASMLAYTETGAACGAPKPAATINAIFGDGPNGLGRSLGLNPPLGQPGGSATYLQYPGGQLLSQANGTLEFWVYLKNYGAGVSLVDQGQYYTACGGWTFGMSVSPAGQLQASAWNAFTALDSGTTTVPLNTWTHLAVSWGSAGAKLYINGVLVGSDISTGMPAANFGGSLMVIAGKNAAGVQIDELRVSNIQRTNFALPVLSSDQPYGVGFSSQNVGTSSAAQTVTLSNTGSGPLNISNISTSPGFVISRNNCGLILDAGLNCAIDVAFNPSVTGWRLGGLVITSDAATSPNVVNLSGYGVTPSGTVTPIISGGGYHSAALKFDGALVTWGWNGSGQLGDGTTADSLSPLSVMPSMAGVAAVAAGAYHTAILKSSGSARKFKSIGVVSGGDVLDVLTWGANDKGQLGDSTLTNSSVPVTVSGLTDVAAVAAGTSHTVALKLDGTVWAWGWNTYNQLGNGTMVDSNVPVQVQGLTDVMAVAAGNAHTVALKSDGTVWTWGYNVYGQLGDGIGASHLTPVKVPGLSDVIAVSAGFAHTVALKSDGTVWTWGLNDNGQLGDGTVTRQLSPLMVPGLVDVVTISTGSGHTVALKLDGTVWTWGWNFYGQLGDGTSTDSLSPIAVPGLNNVAKVSAGSAHTVVMKSDGWVMAWGDNHLGGLGDGTRTLSSSPVQTLGIGGVGFLNLLTNPNTAPVLTYSIEPAYGTVGVAPAIGSTTATMHYKAVYTDSDNQAPAVMKVCIDLAPCVTMTVDTGAAAALHDGNYANGEQYVYNTTLAAGSHTYYFTTSDGVAGVNLPSAAKLNGPTISNSVDLVATAVSVPASANIGTTINISSTVTNNGTTVTAAYSAVQYHLSTSATVNSKTLLLGTSYISGLAAGTSKTVATPVTIPTNLAPRDYYVWMTVDVGNAEVESNETNNLLMGNLITIVRDVDLVATAVSVPASANIGTTINISSTVTNNGTTVTAAYSAVQYHLSTSATVNSKTLLLGTSYISGLAAGTSKTVATPVTIPTNLAPRDYYVWMTVDVGNAEVESNETNNLLMGNLITIVRDVDLVATAVSVPASANIGTTINISSTVTNNGTTVTAAYSAVQYHLSTSATVNSKTLLLGTSYISGLAAGTSKTVATPVTIPTNLAPRDYYVWMTVDVGNAEVESNETNNLLMGNLITIVRDVDLVATAVSVPASANIGTTINISSTVTNNGTTVTAAYSAVQYHLSTSATVNSKTLLLGTSYISGLAAGTSKTVATPVTIPTNLAPRDYYVWMTVDVGNAEVESNETNNLLMGNLITIVRDVDLVATAVSVPASANIGTTINISSTVTNNGTTVTAAYSAVQYHLSTSATVNSKTLLLGTSYISGLAAGTSKTVATPVTIPTNLAPRDYYVWMTVDVGNAEVESNETNNVLMGNLITINLALAK